MIFSRNCRAPPGAVASTHPMKAVVRFAAELPGQWVDVHRRSRPRRAHPAHLPVDQLRSDVLAELRAFANGADQHDDMTMVLMKIEIPA